MLCVLLSYILLLLTNGFLLLSLCNHFNYLLYGSSIFTLIILNQLLHSLCLFKIQKGYQSEYFIYELGMCNRLNSCYWVGFCFLCQVHDFNDENLNSMLSWLFYVVTWLRKLAYFIYIYLHFLLFTGTEKSIEWRMA